MSLDTTHLVVDFETLGKRDNAVVTRIACTPFKLSEKDITYNELFNRTFYIALSIKDQKENYKREIDKSTLDWWKKQSKDLQKLSALPTDNDLSLQTGMDQFKSFVKSHGYSQWKSFVWARGSYFECGKFETMHENVYGEDERPFLNTYKFHDCRTYNWLLSGGPNGGLEIWEPSPMPKEFIKHHAAHDAALDAFRIIKLFWE